LSQGFGFYGEKAMNAINIESLPTVIRKLARIHDDDQLDALLRDYAADCRGLTNDRSQLHTASELFRVRQVARVLANVLELDFKAVEPMVREVLLPRPRRDSILRLIDEYVRDANHFDKLERERERSATR
jgi:hypothetical protein